MGVGGRGDAACGRGRLRAKPEGVIWFARLEVSLFSFLLTGFATAAVPTIDHPPLGKALAGGDAAVVIGNRDYSDLPDVPYADRDADAFAEWLRRTRRVPQNEVHLLKDETQLGMRDAIIQAAAEVEPGGTLWIYYAGHGVGLPGPEGRPERTLVGVRAETDYRRIPEYVLRESDIERLVAGSQAARVLLVLDACYTNAGRDGKAVLEGRPAILVGDDAPKGNLTVLSAASPDEVAGAYKTARHGLFTWAVIGALSGWADGANGASDGEVDLEEVATWTRRAVSHVSRDHQTPVIYSAAEADLGAIKVGSALLGPPAIERLPMVAGPRAPIRLGLAGGGVAVAVVGAGLLGAGLVQEQKLLGNEELLRSWESLGQTADSVGSEPEVRAVNILYGAGLGMAGAGILLGSVGIALPVGDDRLIPGLVLGWRW